MRSSSIFAAAVILAASAGAANAAIVVYNFGLDGLQEVPANASPGIGSATVTLDTVSGAVSVTGTYSGMIGTVTAAHIHGLAPVGVNAGILIHLTHTGGTSGTLGGGGVLSAANIQGMLDELTYINVHTTFLPGGEIRGQVVPTPASLALMGLGGLAGLRRRR
ncbi:MAG: CHRD domain-containing protein [Phycisphaeraceae bacterium]|nr:CHRD domain-containing protein [Phycisphaerae bacterium]MBX3392396.1 CHRD domain-containing protein [Phycisphaeraceae bacterium]